MNRFTHSNVDFGIRRVDVEFTTNKNGFPTAHVTEYNTLTFSFINTENKLPPVVEPTKSYRLVYQNGSWGTKEQVALRGVDKVAKLVSEDYNTYLQSLMLEDERE
jgi:hypothetical protein